MSAIMRKDLELRQASMRECIAGTTADEEARRRLASILERHFSVADLAERLSLSPSTIIRIFRDEPGVVKIGTPDRLVKRPHLTLRIPESVARRVYDRLRSRSSR